LSTLSDLPGSKKKARRVGRGIGSTKGKTCGRGHKGQKSRSGSTGHHDRSFEGGQTPFYKRVRKYGFTNPTKVDYDVVNLDRLQYLINKGRLDPSKTITMKHLFDAGQIRVPEGVKILAKRPDRFNTKVDLEVTDVSEAARKRIEELGGSVKRVWYNPRSMVALLKPEKFPIFKPNRGAPPPKKMHRFDDWGQIEYYAKLAEAPQSAHTQQATQAQQTAQAQQSGA